MNLLSLAISLVSLVIALTPGTPQEQKFDHTKQAGFDAQGNIYVSSDEGKLIKMAEMKHCLMATVANDEQTVGCLVQRGLKPEEVSLQVSFPQPLQLEIYLRGGQMKTIDPGVPIRDWHFWKDGKQVAVYSGRRDRPGTYALYDAASARVIERFAEPSDERLLPRWAKSQMELQDESVPMRATLTEERTNWIAKVLRQLGKIKPGMRREDLVGILKEEGGISTRLERTFVSVECPYIKVHVRFKAANDDHNVSKEDPDDIIKSISQPYLDWSVTD